MLFSIEEEEYPKKAREAGKREGCLLRRKPPQPSGETKGRLVKLDKFLGAKERINIFYQ